MKEERYKGSRKTMHREIIEDHLEEGGRSSIGCKNILFSMNEIRVLDIYRSVDSFTQAEVFPYSFNRLNIVPACRTPPLP